MASTTTVADPVVERAVALAHEGSETAVKELAALGRAELEKARMELVRRISLHSDDYEATAALSLVNRAIAAAGWEDPYNWKHRRKP
jgi:gamma-glutamylcysteine synthetase